MKGSVASTRQTLNLDAAYGSGLKFEYDMPFPEAGQSVAASCERRFDWQ